MQGYITITATGEVRDSEGNLKETFPIEERVLVDVHEDGTFTPVVTE